MQPKQRRSQNLHGKQEARRKRDGAFLDEGIDAVTLEEMNAGENDKDLPNLCGPLHERDEQRGNRGRPPRDRHEQKETGDNPEDERERNIR